MKMPGFTAEKSLYIMNAHYYKIISRATSVGQVTPQIPIIDRWPPEDDHEPRRSGLCAKASRFCQTGRERPWCDILDICYPVDY